MDKLKDWLKDKKNQPAAAGILVLVIIAVGAVIYMTMSGGGGAGDVPDPSAGMMPSMSGDPNMQPTAQPVANPGQTPAPDASTAQQASPTPQTAANSTAKPGEKKNVKTAAVMASRKDPFLPLDWKPGPNVIAVSWVNIPPTEDLLPRAHIGTIQTTSKPETQQPARRMAGLLLNGRIYAIIESDGKTETVQPGDMLADRLAVVERIDRDKVILRTTTGKPRLITVRMSAASKQQDVSTPSNTTPTGMPGGRRIPGMGGMTGMGGMGMPRM